MHILVDAMGGDNAPKALVDGCVEAVGQAEGFDILLLGDARRLKELLLRSKADVGRISIIHCDQAISGEDAPVKAIRTKKNSSMVIGLEMLKHHEGDVFLSAGNSGALMAGSLMLLGRSQDIDRPALAAVLPTSRGACLLLDAGLNTMCKPVNLVQFAHMGSIYAQEVLGMANPRVGLLNVGTEDAKGNDVVKKTFQCLSHQEINFIGNIESRDVLYGAGDVLVADGFTGNMVLKAIEGSVTYVMDSVRNIFSRHFLSRIAASLVVKDLRKLKKRLDVDEHGGAPILGINGLVIKSHGSSTAGTIRHAVLRAFRLAGSTFRQRMLDMGRDLSGLNIDKDMMVI